MITNEQLAEFCAAVDVMRAAYFAQHGLTVSAGMEKPVTFNAGPKKAKIITSNGPQISVFCFVDMVTGDILKADSWNRAAKGVRGNIANGADDVTPHGAAYAQPGRRAA